MYDLDAPRNGKVIVADLFAGAGGTSTGALRAFSEMGVEVELTAINHWDVAVSTHAMNHPNATHLCADLDALQPLRAIPGGHLDLLWASPSCVEFSFAKGGKPLDDQSRATAWCVVRWAEALEPTRIIVENVKQFELWGPLDAQRRPDKKKRGAIFRAWVGTLESLGYVVEWRVCDAADFGAAQTRHRLFVQARNDGKPIVWPVPTHSKHGGATMFGTTEKWRGSREIIDFGIESQSIFDRRKPLAPNTIKRIVEGFRRFGDGPLAEAFVVVLRNHATPGSLDTPLPTITAGGTHLALVEPFITSYYGDKGGVPRVRAIDEPLPTIPTENRFGLVEPYLIEVNHSGPRRARSLSETLPTVTAKNGLAIVEPYVTALASNSAADRLLEIDGKLYELDIRLRMLQPLELQRGQGLPDDYRFSGTKGDQTRMIGNAVNTDMACALVKAAFADMTAIDQLAA